MGTTPADIEAVRTLVLLGSLDAQDSFMQEPAELVAAHANGCGSALYKIDMVPDSIYGISIKPTCQIHDWDYEVGQTIADKESADRRFLNNMLRLIDARQGWYDRIRRPLARRRALKYYEAVHAFGGPSFWKGKNRYG